MCISYAKCVECGKVSLQGSLCDACEAMFAIGEEDERTVLEIYDRALSHILPEKTARFMGLQLDIG